MAACDYTVINKEGEKVESLLFKGLEDYYDTLKPDPLTGLDNETLVEYYNLVSDTNYNPRLKTFITDLVAKSKLSIDEAYDENGQLLVQHAIKFLKESKIEKEVEQPLGGNILSSSVWKTKALEITSNLAKRIEFLKEKKFTTREKSEVQRLLKQLLEVQNDRDYVKGLDDYISVAAKEMKKVLDAIEREGIDNISPVTIQNMLNVLDNYANITKITQDAKEELKEMSENSSDPKSIDNLSKVLINRLTELKESYDILSRDSYNLSLKLGVRMLASSDNSMLTALREEVRKTLVQTEEGQRKEEEKEEDYIQRIQKAVDDIIIEKRLNNKRETELFFEQLFRAGDDINWVSRWALQGGSTGSALLRSLNAMITKAENTARQSYMSRQAFLNPLYQKYREYMESKGKSTNSMLELYENINEVDENGNATDYFVGKTSSLWTRQQKQLKEYIADFITHLKMLEAENNGPFPRHWDEELNEPVDQDEKLRLMALQQAAKGELNKRYNGEEDLKDRYDKLTKIAKELGENRKKFRNLILSFRAIKDRNSIEAHNVSLEIEAVRKVIYSLTDSYTGNKNEYEFELFRRHYDVVSLPNLATLNAINLLDKGKLKAGKYVSGEEKEAFKIVLPETVSDYLSPQFKNLEKLQKEDPDNIEWKYYEAVMGTIASSERKYSEAYRTYFKKPEIEKSGAERWEDDVDSMLSFDQIWSNYIKPGLKVFVNRPGQDFDTNYNKTISQKMFQENGYKLSSLSKSMPVYLKNSGIETRDQSNNIQMLAMSAYNTAIYYEEKGKILPMIEIFLYLLENRKTTKSFGGDKLMNAIYKGAGKVFSNVDGYMERATDDEKSGKQSNVYKNALDMVNARMFGEVIDSTLNINIPIPFKPGYYINFRKLSKLFSSYVSTTVLSFNIKSGTANVIYGEYQFLQEALGNEFISPKSWAQAQLDYMIDLPGILNDIGRDYPTSKISLLGLLFDPKNEANPLESDYKHTNRFYAVVNTDSLHGVNNLGEHLMHFGTMQGVLRETKVLDKNGKYLTKNGTTEDRNKALSLFDVFEKVSLAADSQQLQTDKRVAQVEIKRGDRRERMPFAGGNIFDYNTPGADAKKNRAVIDTLTNLIQALNTQMHGPYSWRTAPPMKRTFIGGLLLQMRQWFPKGFAMRWLGFSNEVMNSFLALKGGKYSEYMQSIRERSIGAGYFDKKTWADFINKGPSQKFDPLKQTLSGGMNASALRQFQVFTYHMFLAMKNLFSKNIEDAEYMKYGFLKITQRQWRNMEAAEKANVKKVIMTTATRAMLSGFTAMLLAADDDDDKYWKTAFYTMRLQTELSAYSNHMELWRIMQSPAVSVSMIQRFYKLFNQLGEDIHNGEFEVYQSGSKKGRTKIGKDLRDVLPWGNLFQQHKYIKDVINYHYKDSSGLVKN